MIPILGPLIAIADNLVKSGVVAMENWQKRKNARVEAEIELEQARVKATIATADKAQDAEINWDLLAVKNMDTSWKDEFYVLLFAIPLVLCFVPGADVYVERGFAVLQGTPEWYQWAIAIMVAASFGYRKFADFWNKK